ncbi:MAG: PEGA domain-containing protein [FCB group bacterium]|nr:PEGA domain-containing protein [FCB group bacterium]MBL7028278.1 PEGA domain-containing protein [Candidatus Neomarinimicrobiota bacterium]
MKKSLLLGVFVLSVLLISSCAYLVGGGDKQDVMVNSSPEGASIVITTTGGVEMFSGTTPASVTLKRKYKYNVAVNLDGYKENTVMIDQTLNMMVLGNIVCGGIPGGVVDALTGAMWTLEPEQIVVTLEMAALEGGSEELYAVVSYLGTDNQRQSVPILLEKE